MAGFQERLKQLGEKQKGKDDGKAAEQKRGEREGRKSEIGEALAGAETARAEAESGVNDARTALAEADRFVQEHPDGIDPEVAKELAAIRAEAEEAIKKFEDLSGQVEALRAELAALNSEETSGEEQEEESVLPEEVSAFVTAAEELFKSLMSHVEDQQRDQESRYAMGDLHSQYNKAADKLIKLDPKDFSDSTNKTLRSIRDKTITFLKDRKAQITLLEKQLDKFGKPLRENDDDRECINDITFYTGHISRLLETVEQKPPQAAAA